MKYTIVRLHLKYGNRGPKAFSGEITWSQKRENSHILVTGSLVISLFHRLEKKRKSRTRVYFIRENKNISAKVAGWEKKKQGIRNVTVACRRRGIIQKKKRFCRR